MKSSLFSLLIAGLLLSVSVGPISAAPVAGPGGHYYELVVQPNLTWDQANALANVSSFAGLHGHLVTIKSQAEDLFVLGLIYGWQNANLIGVTQPSEFWAGGFQNPIDEIVPTAGWTWVNGEGPFPGFNGQPVYANWAATVGGGHEPNDAHGPASEQYLGLGLKDFIDPPVWNDEGVPSLTAGLVIEFESKTVPDACSTVALLSGASLLLLSFRRRLTV